MAYIIRNPDHQPVTISELATNEVIESRIDELLGRVFELEARRDTWNLDPDEVMELADARNRIVGYAIAQTIDEFGLDIK